MEKIRKFQSEAEKIHEYKEQIKSNLPLMYLEPEGYQPFREKTDTKTELSIVWNREQLPESHLLKY